jgi:aminocarboxymuconate-semialdehyde decarboxylase
MAADTSPAIGAASITPGRIARIWGADHIMLGTDYPFDMAEPDPVGFLGRVKDVSDKDMALVAGGNAERLLGIGV